LEVWAKPNALPQSTNTYNGLITKGYDGSNTQYQLNFQDDPSTGNVPGLLFATYNGSNHGAVYAYGSNIITGNWYHIAGTFDGSRYQIYVNGSLVASSSDSTPPAHTAKVPLLGAFDQGGSIHYFEGALDEARISSIARSADWIATEYNNQNSSSSFYTVGPVSSSAGAPPAPNGLTATAGNAQVSLSWNASTGATSYNVNRSTVSGSSYATVASGLTATSYTDTGLNNGTTYYYVIEAINSAGASPNSNQASATPSAGSSWPNGYAYRRAITIDHTKVPHTDQVNFPVLISGTYGYLANTANGGNVTNANGYDITFTSDAAGSSSLPYEREMYTAATGTVNFWVQVPVVSHTSDTVIYMFYGNSSVSTDQSNQNGTWDSNYRGVWHLPNGSTLSANDSTSNANSGIINGATATTGQIDGAASFSGSSQDIQVGGVSGALDLTGAMTLEVWAKPNALPQSTNTYNGLITKGYDGSNTQYQLNFQDDPSTGNVPGLLFATYNGSNHGAVYAYGSNIITGNWYHIAGTFDGSRYQIYVNGSLVASSSDSTPPAHTAKVPLLGAFDQGGSIHYFEGALDEARISSIARSADWIATEYNNQSGAVTFYAIGAATTSGL
jgi:Concanavalin A-like lectin/glucanases superfamily/Domain of unknown function (DUF2341)/Fibronectin type III domain